MELYTVTFIFYLGILKKFLGMGSLSNFIASSIENEMYIESEWFVRKICIFNLLKIDL